MTFDSEFAGAVDWAQYYRSIGWTVVPALTPGEGKQGQWKRPAVAWREYQSGVPDDVWDVWYGPQGQYLARPNVGLLTGKRIFVLDIDLYKTPAAAQWWAHVLALHNSAMDLETVSQRTGGGGRQLFFRAPPGWNPPTNRTPIGIDIRGVGGFAVLPPSRHDSGRQYEWEDGHEPSEIEVMEAPVWLCAEIDKLVEEHGGQPAGATGQRTSSPGVSISPIAHVVQDGREEVMSRHVWGWVVNLYREAPQKLKGAPLEAECAKAFQSYTRKVKTRLVEPGTSTEDLLEREGRGITAYREKWASAMELWDTRVAEHAKLPPPAREVPEQAPKARVKKTPAHNPETGEIIDDNMGTKSVTVLPPERPSEAVPDDSAAIDKAGFLTTQKGTIVGCIYNAVMAIRTDHTLVNRIRLNQLTGQIILRQPEGEKVAQDNDIVAITCYLQSNYTHTFSVQVVHDAVSAVAAENAFDPLKDYINGLSWDGVERISTWLEDLCGAVVSTEEQRKFVSAVGRAWLISAVARALTPASKCDGVLILQGSQGIGKSTVASILGGVWFTDEMPNLASKDAAIQLHGNWIVELGELAAMSRSDLESTKGFLARTIDKYRPPYGRITTEQPRRCVFIGTTNSLTFLKDETGNRRFWPVECTAIDVESLRALRDQLFAEATVAYHAGEKWWLTDDIMHIATREQELRTDNDDELAGEVLSIANLRPDGICIAEIMKLMDLPKPQPRSTHLRIGSILRKEGWVIRGQTKVSEGFGIQKRYVKGEGRGYE